MKTHRLILFFCFSLIFFTGQVFAADFPGSKTVVAYVQPNQGNPYYAYGTFGIDIGYKYVSEAGSSEKARTKFTFDLTTIPPTAEITSVQLSYYTYNYANSSYKFKLTQIGKYNSPQEIWQNIGQAGSLFTNVAYASGSLNSGALTSMVNSSKGTYLYIGALSQNENNTDSRANIDLTLNIQFSVPPATVNITADNNFTATGGTNHGTMIIDGVNRTIPLAGYTSQKTVGQNLTLSANSPQNDNQGQQRIWHTGTTNPSDWRRNGVYRWPNQTYTFTVATDDNGKRHTANLRKILNNVIFQNSFVGVGNGGVIKVNGTQYNSPKTADGVVELNPVTGETVTQTINGIRYNLGHWSDGSTFPMKTFYPASNTTYTAYYIGRPSNANRNLHNIIAYGQPIKLVWNENPNTNVTQYQIWRKVKRNGIVSEPVLLATKNRGTLTYTDNEYSLTNGYTDDLLWYDVRGYYTVENTYADPEWLAIYGEIIPKQSDSLSTTEKLDGFAVSSFPNPFNPSTKIQVKLPFDDHLQVTIFNSIGERIIELKNENLTKGTYEIIWDGKDAKSMQVNSGIYFVVVKTGTKMTTQKLVLLK